MKFESCMLVRISRVRINFRVNSFPAKYPNCFWEGRLRDFPLLFLLPLGTIDFFLAHHRGAQVHNPGKVDRCEGRDGGLGVSADCTVELSKVIKLGQLLRCHHGPWEEALVLQQRGMCGLQQCFRLPFFPRCVPPEVGPTGRASSSNAGPISNLAVDGRGSARARASRWLPSPACKM